MGKNNKKAKSSKSQSKVKKEEIVQVEEVQVEEVNEDITELKVESDESTKKVKKVVAFSEEYGKLETLRTEEVELRSEKDKLVKLHEEKLKELNSKLKKNRVEQKNIFERLPTLHNKEIKVASKEKRKRNGKNTGGFNKEVPVPKILANYLGLEENTMLARPQVMHLLSEKFKKENLKDGHKTVLDKKNAKKLNRTEGYEINFKDNQSFLASFYNSDNSVSV